MATNNNNTNSQDQSVKSKSINGIFFSLIITVLIIGLLTAGFTYINQQQKNATREHQYAQQVAEQVSGNINAIVKGYRLFVRHLSENKTAAVLLLEKDMAALQDLASSIAEQSADVLKVRFLPAEYGETDTDPLVPLSFSSLDLAHRAENSAQIPSAELHALNSPAKHIALAAAMRGVTGKVIGVVHVAFSAQALMDSVQQLAADAGGVMLAQQAGKDIIELARSVAFKDQQSKDKIKVNNTIWTLYYQPLSAGSFIGQILPASVTLFGMLIVMVMLLIKRLQLTNALRFDQEFLAKLIESKLKGKSHKLLANYTLSETKSLVTLISQIQATEKTPGKEKQSHTATSTGESEASGPAFPSIVSQSEGISTNVESMEGADINAVIFREYDIRGVVGDTLNLEQAYLIGKAIGSLAIDQGEFTMLVARDGRVSSKDLSSTLIRGLVETGMNVIDLGMVPTPLMYFGTHFLSARSGVMVTGSHNPADYNGFKVVIAGDALKGEEIQALYQRIISGQFSSGEGTKDKQDISPDYINRIIEDVQLLKPMKVVVDCGNGVASVIARSLFEALGCEVLTIFCEVDGKFPNHHPDPGNPENMKELAEMVKSENADLGIAFDGDGDRLGIIDSVGKQIMPDRILMVLAADLLLRNPGADVIYDVKSSKHLAGYILSSGGRPIMWKSGHSLIKAKMKETGALLAGEFSGHIFFTERWYGFDDALYAAARLLEVISGDGRTSKDVFDEVPDSLSTPELQLSVPEGVQHKIIKKLQEAGNQAFPNAKIVDIDGIRTEYPGAWGLIRASNTTPSLVFRFEADNQEDLGKVQDIFRTVMKAVLPSATLPF